MKKPTKTWQEAIDYCKQLELGGYKDWRLPDIDELFQLADKSRYNPAIDPIFSGTIPYYYWSSRSYENNTSNAWNVNFNYGTVFIFNKSNNFYVRAVRGGQCGSVDAIRFVDNGDGTVTDNKTGLMWEK